MLIIQENPPTHFDTVKNYFTDRENVRKISSTDFSIDENEINKYLGEFTNRRPNIYAILIKTPNETVWSLKYIGQRESLGIKQRLREHLISCNEQTGSQLERVKLARSSGYEIGIMLVSILPDSNGEEHFRLLYESMLIKEFSAELEWNKQK